MSSKSYGWLEKKSVLKGGKEVLIKVVDQTIPIYVMSCFRLPMSMCSDTAKMMARFWWGSLLSERKIHWLSWKKICLLKKQGGGV